MTVQSIAADARTTAGQDGRRLAERVAYIEGRLGIDGTADWQEDGRPWSAWMRGRSDARYNRTFKIMLGVLVALYAVTITLIFVAFA